MSTLQVLLTVSALLFCLGLTAALTRRSVIMILIGIELMLNAANLNFIVFWRAHGDSDPSGGFMFALFGIAVAAAEAAVGLALILLVYRHYRSTRSEDLNKLKG